MKPENLLYQIGIGLIPKIGTAHARKLIAYTGSAEAVFQEKAGVLEKIPGIGRYIAGQITGNAALIRAEEEIRFMEKNQVNALYFQDSEFPYRLKECEDGPILIFYKGKVDFNHQKIISIVGTRKPTANGRQFTNELIANLQALGQSIHIVSGLAFGIDIIAHKASLKAGFNTLAVLAHGLDRLYPPEHRETSGQIIQQGALVSEFLSLTNPDPQNFVKRNRIIAGLADATIVIESGAKGGSLITADIANSYNRDVFAMPGRVKDDMSLGCNALIAENKAMLLRSADDLVKAMGWQTHPKKHIIQTKLFHELRPEEQQIIAALREQNDQQVDTLASQVVLPVSLLNALLLQLEFAGILQVLPGKVVRLI